jgi:O-methyltransferase
LYVSTWDAITALYDRVVIGGLIYVDDYGAFNGCREAINEFRTQRKIYEPIYYIKENNGRVEAIWWRKTHI